MEFLLQRYSDNRESTLGLFLKKIQSGTDTIFRLMGYSLEDEYRKEKVSKDTRIPAGFYEIVINKAETPLTLKYRQRYPWFKFHLMLKNVPGFTGIYIHSGKNDDWTDGCITVGDNVNNNSIGNGEIVNSAACFQRLYTEIYNHLEGGGLSHIEIRDEISLINK